MEIKERIVDNPNMRKITKEDGAVIMANIEKYNQGTVSQEGTRIDAALLNKINWQNNKSLEFKVLETGETTPMFKLDTTQIYTDSQGSTWLLPAGGRIPVALEGAKEVVKLEGNQTINGIKNFTERPQFNGNAIRGIDAFSSFTLTNYEGLRQYSNQNMRSVEIYINDATAELAFVNMNTLNYMGGLNAGDYCRLVFRPDGWRAYIIRRNGTVNVINGASAPLNIHLWGQGRSWGWIKEIIR